MKKLTHLMLARKILSESDLALRDKILVYFGSIAPDLTPLCLFRPHQYNSRNAKILYKYSSLDFNTRDCLFFFKVGIISHYLADFFTAPHNRQGVVGFCTNHRNYERELHEYFKVNLDDYKFSSSDCNNIKIYLNSLHDRYIDQDFCLERDFYYICNIVCSLYSFSFGGLYNGIASSI